MTIEPLPGNAVFEDRMKGMAVRAADWSPAFVEIQASFRKYEQIRFAMEGPGWPDLAESTLNYKLTQGFNPMILGARTGDLYASLCLGSGIAYFTPNSVFMGTDIPYAKFHQLGEGNNPLRRLVDVTPIMATAWIDILREYLVRGI